MTLPELRKPGAGTSVPIDALLEECARYGARTILLGRSAGARAAVHRVVVAPSGVYVVEAREARGRVEVRELGGIFTRDQRLSIGGRDRTRIVRALGKRVDAVRRTLAAPSGIPVHGILCVVGAEWRLLRTPLQLDAVTVVWPAELSRLISRLGRLGPDDIATYASRLRG